MFASVGEQLIYSSNKNKQINAKSLFLHMQISSWATWMNKSTVHTSESVHILKMSHLFESLHGRVLSF